MVQLRSIKTKDSASLLHQPIISLIDSGLPYIWLPTEDCQMFESVFHLTWDPDFELYFVNESLRDILLSQNTTLSFELAADQASNETIVIDFPFAAFDLQLTTEYPGIPNDTHYFPLKRAANQTQYTLGRTFLQQVYLIADYERSIFSVHHAAFPAIDQQNLRFIDPLPQETSSLSIISALPSVTSSPSPTHTDIRINGTFTSAHSSTTPTNTRPSSTPTPTALPISTYAAIVIGAIILVPALVFGGRFICKIRKKRASPAISRPIFVELPERSHDEPNELWATRYFRPELDELHPAKAGEYHVMNAKKRKQEILQSRVTEHHLKNNRAASSIYSLYLRQSGEFF